MSAFIFISFVCPITLLFICGCIHFMNHFKIKFHQFKKPHTYVTNSRRNSHIQNSNVELQTSNDRNNTTTHHFINRSKLHITHMSHLSELPSFSPSYKQSRSKQLKQCINQLTCCQPKDTDWNFFPISFLFYILFLLILTLIIVSKYDNYTYKMINNSCSNHSLSIGQTVTDWIIIYCVIILNLWESLLNFYRYWTTKECSMLRIGDTKTLYLYYFIYLFSFLTLCILQFHWIYWLFPIIIFSHFAYNLFCVVQFTRILIKQYNAFSNPDRKALSIVNDNMLSSVKIMGYISFISFILNSILLSLMVGCYNINLVTYLPLIYSISSFTFSFNFVRNRVFLTHFVIKLKQIPMKLKNKKDKSKENDINSDDDDIIEIAISPTCADDHDELQTPRQPDKLDRLTLDHMTITSGPSSSYVNEENVLENNKSNNITQQMDQIKNDSNKNIENKLIVSVPTINATQCNDEIISISTLSKQSQPVTPNTEWKLKHKQNKHIITYPLTPLLNSSNNKHKIIDTYRNQSRSEPSSPLIYNTDKKQKQKHKNNFPFAKTPQMKARLSQSPVLNYFKQLSLKAALKTKSVDIIDENNYKVVGSKQHKILKTHSKHKRATKSEGLPQLSQCITHSTSLENENNNNIGNTLLNVFGENVALSPKKSKSKKALEILGIDGDKNDKNEFIFVDSENEMCTDEIEIVDDNFSLNNSEDKNELMSFEKWNAFDEIFPSKELKLEKTMSEQKVELYSGTKRNSKIASSRRSSLLGRDDMVKAVELEMNISDIKEEDEDGIINENQYEFKQNINNNKENKLGIVGKKRKSIKEDSEIVAMLRLMVQHGFYSKKTLNSVEQFRKYNSAK